MSLNWKDKKTPANSSSTSAADPSSTMNESPNWLQMPRELTANILQRLGTLDLLRARKVCTAWQTICYGPAMWKVIHISISACDDDDTNHDLVRVTKEAVDLSFGELIDITIEGFGSDDLFEYILLRSSKLKRLCLTNCYPFMAGRELSLSVRSVPHLEELRISSITMNAQDIEEIGQNCPHLKSLMVDKHDRTYVTCDDSALAIANNMPELRHLQLSGNKMTNDGLQAILDGCPHLQTLHLSWCYNLDLDDGNLRKLCNERVKDFKFYLPAETYRYGYGYGYV